MADKKPRMGKDPLAWIQNSQEVENQEDSKQELQSKPSLQSNKSKPEKPNAEPAKIKKTTQAGLMDGWTRATFIVQEDQLEKLKALAYLQRRNIKEVMAEALSSFFAANQKEVKEAATLYAKSKK